MNKLLPVLALLLTTTGCARKTTIAVKNTKPMASEKAAVVQTDHYKVTTTFGHEFMVDVTRFPKEDHGYNNTCKINYIITNTGTREFLHREEFASGKSSKSNEPAIVFEFHTSDGKKIQKTQAIYFDIAPGRSSEVYTMSIDVGMGACDGEVRPVEIRYRGNN
jgi:hypothetical protein